MKTKKSMTISNWHLEKSHGVAYLRIARPQARNAISLEMWAALPGILAEIGNDQCLLILRGVGGVFSGGADIEEFRTAYTTQEAALENLATMQAAMAAMEACPLPTIAALEGPAIGAALALAACCDLRIASEDARLAIPPAKLGLLYAFGDIARLAELIGPAKAKLLLFTARAIDAETACAWGLIDEIAQPSLDESLIRWQSEVLGRSSRTQKSLKRMFQLLRAGQRGESDETRALFARAFEGEDFQEGYRAFKEKRAPRFSSSVGE